MLVVYAYKFQKNSTKTLHAYLQVYCNFLIICLCFFRLAICMHRTVATQPILGCHMRPPHITAPMRTLHMPTLLTRMPTTTIWRNTVACYGCHSNIATVPGKCNIQILFCAFFILNMQLCTQCQGGSIFFEKKTNFKFQFFSRKTIHSR